MKQNKAVLVISFLSIVIFILIISIGCVQINSKGKIICNQLLALKYKNYIHMQSSLLL